MKYPVRLTLRLKVLFYSIFGLLFGSGTLWWLSHDLFPDQLDPFNRWCSMPLIQIHGAMAMAALVILGWMIPSHIQGGWHGHRNRTWGIILSAACLILVVTGYGLYYFGPDWLRIPTEWVHIGVGVGFPLILAIHVWVGKIKK